jgi:DNA helicase-2/ATP-dependent DNA helicase PcrA
LILAGAGSGKTRVLTYRAAYLIASGIASTENTLLLTFTNKAAGEMLKRVEKLLGSEKRQVITGGTFHSWCAKVLRKYSGEAGLDSNFVIFDESDQLDTVKRAMERVGVDVKSVKPGSVLANISSAKNELIGYEEYAGFARGNFQQTVARTYLAYQQLLKKYRALDFDDLLVETVRLMKQNPEVLEKLQKRFEYVLVDEYQDTNKAQYEITKRLTWRSKNLTVVGDAAQAIYSWRGADYRNLLLLKQDFPELTTMNLEQNYRSTQIILSAANQIISHNKSHPILKLWSEREGGEKVIIFEAESELGEAGFVAGEIEKAIINGGKYSDFAVLYRTNAQSRVLEEACLHRGIPYALVGGVRFYERKEIKDVLAYLRLLLNPDDEVSKKRAEKNGKTRLSRLLGREWDENKMNSLEILESILKETDYLDQFDPLNEEDAARLENIRELQSVAAEYPKLAEFLEQVALTEKESKKPSYARASEGKGAVTLMTVHSAKGLEFKTVFMVGMEEGLFPHSRSLMEKEAMEEERRLCYVGMTRAMDKLYLTYATRRLFFGQRSNNPVSRFLGDIPEKLIINSGNPLRGVSPRTILKEDWGFDKEGNWKWSPDDSA